MKKMNQLAICAMICISCPASLAMTKSKIALIKGSVSLIAGPPIANAEIIIKDIWANPLMMTMREREIARTTTDNNGNFTIRVAYRHHVHIVLPSADCRWGPSSGGIHETKRNQDGTYIVEMRAPEGSCSKRPVPAP